MTKKLIDDNSIGMVEKIILESDLMLDVAVPQKELSSIPKPADRPTDWINYPDCVAFIFLDKRGMVRIRTGHICSTAGTSHLNTDNISSTVVWSDQMLNDLADNADDAYEISFDPKDPRLLRLDEIIALQDLQRAVDWFAGIYSPEFAACISALLSLPDFGRSEELREEAQLWEQAGEAARKKLGYYDNKGVFNRPALVV